MAVDVVSRIADLREALDAARACGATVGFVPTMGAFHDGHRSLMRAARAGHQVVVASLFVNPLQFGPSEDLARYPRDAEGDRAVAEAEGVDLLFVPAVAEMYPDGARTTVSVAGVTAGLCGASRPGHFDGVATVVAKLFGIAGPCTAYFGRKDFQQLVVVRRLAADLCLPVEVVGCPLVREADGLAMSSRNRNLAATERDAALALFRALSHGAHLVESVGLRDAGHLRQVLSSVVAAEPRATLEYAEVVDAATLEPVAALTGEVLVALAARVGAVRLIDNMTITIETISGRAAVDLGVLSAQPREEAACAAR